MSRRKPTPHVFIPDPDVPPDINGNGACGTCHCMGRPDDSRHKMPDLFDQDAESRRRAGEKEDA